MFSSLPYFQSQICNAQILTKLLHTLEELLEEEDEPTFWQQDPPADSRAFMSTIWRGMKKIFREQIRLRKQVAEQTSHLDRIEEGLQ